LRSLYSTEMTASSTLFSLLLVIVSAAVCRGGWISSSTSSTRLSTTHSFVVRFQQQRRQPAFRQVNHFGDSSTGDGDGDDDAVERRRRFSYNAAKKKSSVGDVHAERIRTAGRVGTKRYVNPSKVFIGNLPYNATEDVLRQWVCSQMGLPAPVLLHELKIVKDWKTGRSKGYGFVVFTQPIHATVCLDTCQGKSLYGRILTVGQGKKKQDAQQIFVKEERSEPADADERAIEAGMRIAEDPNDDDDEDDDDEKWILDPEEAAILRRLDPDLVDDYYDDEEDEGVDPSSATTGSSTMNRAQRREAARGNKRKKLPSKGFGGDNSNSDVD